MYRARIWIPEYWIPFLNFAKKNFAIFSMYDLFALFEVYKTDQNLMSEEVYELMIEFEKSVKK